VIPIDLSGKTALITGGTRGIGRIISRRLAEAGASTLAIYKGDEDSATVSLEERKSFSADHFNFQGDISLEDHIEVLVSEARLRFPRGLDYVVLNAGIGLSGKVTEIEPASWRKMFDVNLGSAFLLSRALVPMMRRGGSLVAIGSGSGHDPIPGLAFYGASKAALNMFVADLAQEIGPLGIRANVVSPGSTDSSRTDNAPSPTVPQNGSFSNALKRRGLPDDVAGAVLFFCSDLSSFITGQAIRVNGGAI
jgi:3-oxoacyl-[acyl-carrier protein] reductase